MKKQVATKEIHKKLPYSGGPSIKWSITLSKWWWCSIRHPKETNWKPKFYINTRIANGYHITLGAVVIFWPARWLEAPARQSHPEVFND